MKKLASLCLAVLLCLSAVVPIGATSILEAEGLRLSFGTRTSGGEQTYVIKDNILQTDEQGNPILINDKNAIFLELEFGLYSQDFENGNVIAGSSVSIPLPPGDYFSFSNEGQGPIAFYADVIVDGIEKQLNIGTYEIVKNNNELTLVYVFNEEIETIDSLDNIEFNVVGSIKKHDKEIEIEVPGGTIKIDIDQYIPTVTEWGSTRIFYKYGVPYPSASTIIWNLRVGEADNAKYYNTGNVVLEEKPNMFIYDDLEGGLTTDSSRVEIYGMFRVPVSTEDDARSSTNRSSYNIGRGENGNIINRFDKSSDEIDYEDFKIFLSENSPSVGVLDQQRIIVSLGDSPGVSYSNVSDALLKQRFINSLKNDFFNIHLQSGVYTQADIEKMADNMLARYGTNGNVGKKTIEYLLQITATPTGTGFYSNEASLEWDGKIERTYESEIVQYQEISVGGQGTVAGALKIEKKDSKTGQVLSGVKMKLMIYDDSSDSFIDYSAPGQTLIKQTDLNGVILFNRLQTGRYKIVEVQGLDGYQDDMLIVEGDEFDFVYNSNGIYRLVENVPLTTTSYTVNKVWVGGSSPRPTIELQLLQNGLTYGPTVKLENDQISFTWEDLPDTTGTIYSVVEVNVPENYISMIDGNTITNTYVSPKTSLLVNKIWIGGPDLKPDIEIQLLRDGEPFGDVKILRSGETTLIFDDLELTDSMGTEYIYSFVELDVEGYESSVDGNTITNTYVSPKTSLLVNKIWIGGPDLKPDIEIQLLRDGEPFGDVKILRSGETTLLFDDLELTDSMGTEYIYSFVELDVEGYESSVDGNTITNTYVPVEPEDSTFPVIPTEPSVPNIPVVPIEPGVPEKPIIGLPPTGVQDNIMYIYDVMVLVGVLLLMVRKHQIKNNDESNSF